MASVAAGVGGLAATGLLGQIERNHPKAFIGALAATVIGTFLPATAGSGILGDAKTHARRVRGVQVVGALFVLLGVGLAVVTAVRTASDRGRPVIDVSVTPVKIPGKPDSPTRTYLVDAHTKASNLPAAASVTVLVDGLRLEAASEKYAPTNVFHGKYRAKQRRDARHLRESSADPRNSLAAGHDFRRRRRAGGGCVREEETPTNPCGDYKKGVSTEARGEAKARKDLDPGCVVPAPITADELDLPAGRAP